MLIPSFLPIRKKRKKSYLCIIPAKTPLYRKNLNFWKGIQVKIKFRNGTKEHFWFRRKYLGTNAKSSKMFESIFQQNILWPNLPRYCRGNRKCSLIQSQFVKSWYFCYFPSTTVFCTFLINKCLNAVNEFTKNVQCLLGAQHAADDCDNCACTRPIGMAYVT
jgi:hypothetical protein